MATVPTGSSLAELRSASPPDYILRLFPIKALAALPSEPIAPFYLDTHLCVSSPPALDHHHPEARNNICVIQQGILGAGQSPGTKRS